MTPAQRLHRPAIASHRGGAFLWPENSLLAFRNTLALQVEQAECDVHLSADGVPVVIHDAVLDRTTEGSGPVSARGAAELARLRLRGAGDQHIPLLKDVVGLFRDSEKELQVELKAEKDASADPRLLDSTLAVLDQAAFRGRAIIISFNATLVAAAQRAGGLAGTIWLFDKALLRLIGPEGILGVAREHGIGTVETQIGALDADLVRQFRQAGLRIGAWGVDRADSIAQALALGLDVFATDDPVLAQRLRG